MNAPKGLDPALDLARTIDKYCELSPDIYARAHYQAMRDGLEDPWNGVTASWDWLRNRLEQDTSELVSIGDCQHGVWWEDWDFLPLN